jgi:hypothetical protein
MHLAEVFLNSSSQKAAGLSGVAARSRRTLKTAGQHDPIRESYVSILVTRLYAVPIWVGRILRKRLWGIQRFLLKIRMIKEEPRCRTVEDHQIQDTEVPDLNTSDSLLDPESAAGGIRPKTAVETGQQPLPQTVFKPGDRKADNALSHQGNQNSIGRSR